MELFRLQPSGRLNSSHLINYKEYRLGSNPDKESVFTLPADRRVFTLIGAPITSYYTIGVKAYRNVDDDIAVGGIIESGLVTAKQNPYQPRPALVLARQIINWQDIIGAELIKTQAAFGYRAALDAASDTILTPIEKYSAKVEFNGLAQEVTSLGAQATALGITTEKTDFDTAYNTLNTYITPLIASTTSNSTIVAATYIANWKAYYDKRAILQAKMAEVAATKATWDGVGSKPELVKGDGTTTLGSNFIYTGTLSANQVNASGFTAQTANIADAAIGTAKIADGSILTAKIGDLQVDTLKIADNAITVQQAVSSNVNSAPVSSKSWTDTDFEITVVVPSNCPNMSFAIMAVLNGYANISALNSETNYCKVRIVRDSNDIAHAPEAIIATTVNVTGAQSTTTRTYEPGIYLFSDTPGAAGTYTYRVQIRSGISGRSVYLTRRGMTIVGCKR